MARVNVLSLCQPRIVEKGFSLKYVTVIHSPLDSPLSFPEKKY